MGRLIGQRCMGRCWGARDIHDELGREGGERGRVDGMGGNDTHWDSEDYAGYVFDMFVDWEVYFADWLDYEMICYTYTMVIKRYRHIAIKATLFTTLSRFHVHFVLPRSFMMPHSYCILFPTPCPIPTIFL
jgi:hypothetical protein